MTDAKRAAPSRRAFLLTAPAALIAGELTLLRGDDAEPQPQDAAPARSGITVETLAEAEKLAAVNYTPGEREQILRVIDEHVARGVRRRSHSLKDSLAPATVFRVLTPPAPPASPIFSTVDPGPLPKLDEDVAFAPVTSLSHWIRTRQITCRKLSAIYLERLARIGGSLLCTVTLMRDAALARADALDKELAAGRWRGPLHGIPWGAKDLFDTAGVVTGWGAEPFQRRVPKEDAAVVRKLDAAGAVLIAKLALGALAYGDIWYGGKTRNPWNTDEGSSGSSAGSASATAAGLVAFALGTETLGSIVSPSMRCGVTGLRPTFGRVSRAGAMALCWTLDKVGPLCRTVEDTMLVLAAISGADPADPSSVDAGLAFDGSATVKGMKVGIGKGWFSGRGANALDRVALDAVKTLGAEIVELELPELPYDALLTPLHAEAAAAFEELTLENKDDQLSWQAPEAWPNTFRASRFISAIDLVQSDRLRREVMEAMQKVFAPVDVLLGPSFVGSMLLITNATGHPSLTLRTGFLERESRDRRAESRSDSRAESSPESRRRARVPHGITIWGKHWDEGTIARLGTALEKELGVWKERPPL